MARFEVGLAETWPAPWNRLRGRNSKMAADAIRGSQRIGKRMEGAWPPFSVGFPRVFFGLRRILKACMFPFGSKAMLRGDVPGISMSRPGDRGPFCYLSLTLGLGRAALFPDGSNFLKLEFGEGGPQNSQWPYRK